MNDAASEVPYLMAIIQRFTRDDLRRMRLLKNNIIDLSAALDDVDAELAPALAERAHLDTLLREAEAELAALIQRAA